jgi:hypothetical protein
MIAVNNFSGLPTTGHIYVAGTGILGGTYGVFVTRSTNGGTTWVDAISLGANTHGADIAICPNGTVYVFYLAYTFSPPDHYTIRLTYRWLPTGQGISWQGPKVIWAHANSETLYSTKGNGSGDLLRHKNANPDDFFVSNALPRVAVNPANGHIYVVYADLPYAGSSTDRGDIFAREGEPEANGELKWTGAARKINNDGTATDQWNPSIAVNPSGTQVFIGYYSRQGDAANNAWIRAYGAKAKLATGLASATFDVFPVGTSSFTNLFNGTTTSSPPTSPWLYDHVWVQDLVCFDEDARVVNCGSEVFWGPLAVGQGYSHFCADDYSWLSADSTYFYFAWRDCSDTCNVTWDQVNYSRADANVRFAKIRQ